MHSSACNTVTFSSSLHISLFRLSSGSYHLKKFCDYPSMVGGVTEGSEKECSGLMKNRLQPENKKTNGDTVCVQGEQIEHGSTAHKMLDASSLRGSSYLSYLFYQTPTRLQSTGSVPNHLCWKYTERQEHVAFFHPSFAKIFHNTEKYLVLAPQCCVAFINSVVRDA